MAPTKLNEPQLDVLRRICHSETPVTSDDSRLAATVYALRSRGLVTTAQADGRWSAAPTEAGRQRLAQADPTLAPSTTGSASSTAAEAAELIIKLQQAGGTVRITDPTPDERARWRRALRAARADHLVPEGHQLQHTGRDKGDLVITLRPGSRPQMNPFRSPTTCLRSACTPQLPRRTSPSAPSASPAPAASSTPCAAPRKTRTTRSATPRAILRAAS
ncbi:hypothetical protein WKI71_45605 [Streptomyces sp. MS1.AVA.1]|uniref:Uncharacterized protein n=1 Tax=Streptomyces machairae TaxID=3134109 RepID=A0ABU8UWQ4_9ACTN